MRKRVIFVFFDYLEEMRNTKAKTLGSYLLSPRGNSIKDDKKLGCLGHFFCSVRTMEDVKISDFRGSFSIMKSIGALYVLCT